MTEPMSKEEHAAIRARCEATPPGPWYWEGGDGRPYRLFTPKDGGTTVMDFIRCGMQGAQPRFPVNYIKPDGAYVTLGGILREADELDLRSHPIAMFFAAVRQDVPRLLDEVERLTDELEDAAVGVAILTESRDLEAQDNARLRGVIQQALDLPHNKDCNTVDPYPYTLGAVCDCDINRKRMTLLQGAL